jgi:hypothetical protein
MRNFIVRNSKKVELVFPSVYSEKIFNSAFNNNVFKRRIVEHYNINFVELKKNGNDKLKNEKIRLAFIGEQKSEKGWDIFKNLATNYKSNFVYYYLGNPKEVIKNVINIPVKFSKQDFNPMTKLLLDNEIDIIILWSIKPETYGFTYYEGLLANSFVITFKNSGNIAEMVKIFKNGIVLDNINELMKLLTDDSKLLNIIQDQAKYDIKMTINEDLFNDSFKENNEKHKKNKFEVFLFFIFKIKTLFYYIRFKRGV